MGDAFHFGAVVLAAGASVRMGRPKQLLPIAGKSLVVRSAEAALESGARPVVVVLGAGADSIRPALDGLPVLVAINRHWQRGLSSSVRAGIRMLDAGPGSLAAAVLILCDQPNLSPQLIRRLVRRHRERGHSIVAAAYDGHPGAPALFARRHFPELLGLRGPNGARPLFARHADVLDTVDLPELGVDLDNPSDYRRFITCPSTSRRG